MFARRLSILVIRNCHLDPRDALSNKLKQTGLNLNLLVVNRFMLD
jgi:hypothetical protein